MERYEQLAITREGGVATVTLNRPEVLNALSSRTFAELIRACEELDGDPAVRAVLFRGAGERAFCAGSDLNETRALEGEEIRRFILLDFRCKARIARCRVPTIAAIHGYALGGGLELALACDVRLVSRRAVLGLPEVNLGTVAGSGGIQRLRAIVGRGVAADLIFTGRKIDAQEAYRIGLANEVVDPDALLARASEYARELAGKNPIALQGSKTALQDDEMLPAGPEAAYHSLLSQACRAGGWFRREADQFLKRDGGR